MIGFDRHKVACCGNARSIRKFLNALSFCAAFATDRKSVQTVPGAALVVTTFLISSEVLAPPVPPNYGHSSWALICSHSPLLKIHPTNKLEGISIGN